MELSEGAQEKLVEVLAEWGPSGAILMLCIWCGLPEVAKIIKEVGKCMNERHRTNLAHKRSMAKIENQLKKDADKVKKGEE